MFNTRVAALHSARLGCVRTSVRTVTPARLNVNHVRHRGSGRSSRNASCVKAKGSSADSKTHGHFASTLCSHLPGPLGPPLKKKKTHTREPALTTKKCVIKESGLTTLGRGGSGETQRPRVFFSSRRQNVLTNEIGHLKGANAPFLSASISACLYFFPLPRTVPTSSFSFLRVCADNVTDSTAVRVVRSALMRPCCRDCRLLLSSGAFGDWEPPSQRRSG